MRADSVSLIVAACLAPIVCDAILLLLSLSVLILIVPLFTTIAFASDLFTTASTTCCLLFRALFLIVIRGSTLVALSALRVLFFIVHLQLAGVTASALFNHGPLILGIIIDIMCVNATV